MQTKLVRPFPSYRHVRELMRISELTSETATVIHPMFYCGGTRDLTCLPEAYIKNFQKYCPNTTYLVLEAGHSAHITQSDVVNSELHKWIKTFYDDGSTVESRL